MKNLEKCMAAVGCKSLSGIVITHLHHDHYGGIDSLQDKYGPNIPVYKSAVKESNWELLAELKRRDLLHIFLDEGGNAKFNPKKMFQMMMDKQNKPEKAIQPNSASSTAIRKPKVEEEAGNSNQADEEDGDGFDMLDPSIARDLMTDEVS